MSGAAHHSQGLTTRRPDCCFDLLRKESIHPNGGLVHPRVRTYRESSALADFLRLVDEPDNCGMSDLVGCVAHIEAQVHLARDYIRRTWFRFD